MATDYIELLLVFNSLTMIDLINRVRGGSWVPIAKTWRADIFPAQTEQTRNMYYMANTVFSNMKDAPSKLY